MRIGRLPFAAFADSVPPRKFSKSKGVESMLGRVAAQCRQKLLNVERLWKNSISAVCKTSFSHLVGCRTAYNQHFGFREATLDVLQNSQADFRRVEHGR